MSTTTRTVGYLGRCPVKGCRHVRRVDVEATGARSDRYGNVHTVVTYSDLRRAIDAADTTCPEHGLRTRSWYPVKGTYSERHTCGARCLNAIGPNCECSCAGANHGANHR